MKQIVIDTRQPEEYSRSHVEGAISIPVMEFASGKLPESLNGVPKETPIILYCLSGQRSNTCSMILREYGFSDITNGINEGRTRQLLSKT